MFKVTRFVYFGPYLKSCNYLEYYQCKGQLMDVVANPRDKFMEDVLFKVTDWVILWGVAVLTYLDVHFQF